MLSVEEQEKEAFASKDSYLSKEQFRHLDDELTKLITMVLGHTATIDNLEHRLIHIRRRKA